MLIREEQEGTSVDSLDVLLQKSSVVLLLHLRHAHLQDGLLLWRQALLHIGLQPPQQEWPEHLQWKPSHQPTVKRCKVAVSPKSRSQ